MNKGGLWSPGRRSLTAGLVLTITLVAFEALAVATVLPRVAHDLGGIALYGWVFSAFMLANLLGITVGGFQADRHGAAPVLAVGLSLFAGGLAAAGLAPSMLVLVAARAVQGVGAGALSAAVYVGVARGYADELRPQMFALMSTAWVVPGLIGPAVAAGVASASTWRAVFLGLLPLVLLGGVLTLPALRRMGAAAPGATPAAGAAPAPGAAPGTETTASAPLTVPVIQAVRLAGGTAVFLGGLSAPSPLLAPFLLLAGAVLAVPALHRLLPAGTLRAAPGLPSAIAARALLNFTFFGADAYVPLAITSAGRSVTAGGLVLTAATLSWTAGSWVQVRSNRRWSRRSVVSAGLGLIVVGIAGQFVALQYHLALGVAVVAWGLAGLGMGLAYQTLSVTVLAAATPGREGEATAALQLADVLGVALGAGVGGAAIAFAHRHGSLPRTGITVAFLAAGAGGLVALGVAHRLPRGRPSVSPSIVPAAGEPG